MAKRTLAPSTIMMFGVLRAVPLAVLGGCYLWMARFIDGNGGRGVDWLGAAIVASLFGLAAIFALTRAFHRARRAAHPIPPPPPGPESDEPRFDADAALQHYLAGKAANAPPPDTGRSRRYRRSAALRSRIARNSSPGSQSGQARVEASACMMR